MTTMTSPGEWSAAHDPSTGEVTVAVDGLVEIPDPLCLTGEFVVDYAVDNDTIIDVKVLSTADLTATLPVTVPGSLLCALPSPLAQLLCMSDLTSVGGFIFFSDTSAGASTPGSFRTNIRDVAYSGWPGRSHRHPR